MAKTVHTLKVTLRDVRPPVWRRIEVTSDLRLSELAAVLTGAMGWYGGHIHMFDIGGELFDLHHPQLDPIGLDEARYRIGDVLPSVGMKARWDYDFGDGWEHDLLVEAISLRKPKTDLPVCLAGRRACPPEDCGGPWGYAHLLEVLADPSHPEHEEMARWAPLDFNSDRFDVAEATRAMREMPVL